MIQLDEFMDRLQIGKRSTTLSYRGTASLIEEKKQEVLTEKIRAKMLDDQLHPTFYTEMMETIEEVEGRRMLDAVVKYEEDDIKFNPLPEIPERLKRVFDWS